MVHGCTVAVIRRLQCQWCDAVGGTARHPPRDAHRCTPRSTTHTCQQCRTPSTPQGPSQVDELGGGYGDVPLSSAEDPELLHDPLSAPAPAAAPPAAAPPAEVPPPAAAAPAPHQPAATAAAGPPVYPPPSTRYPSVPTPAVAPRTTPLVAAPDPVGSPDLRISVHSPTTLRGPTGLPGLDESFISFEVTTATALPAFRASQVTVRRRFKDVVALSKLLGGLLPGTILPARPERNFVEGRLRMSPAFVEQR